MHFGDDGSMPGSMALSPDRIWTAPIALADQSLVGAAAVVLPGTSFSKAAVLAAGAAPEIGAELAGASLGTAPPSMPGGLSRPYLQNAQS